MRYTLIIHDAPALRGVTFCSGRTFAKPRPGQNHLPTSRNRQVGVLFWGGGTHRDTGAKLEKRSFAGGLAANLKGLHYPLVLGRAVARPYEWHDDAVVGTSNGMSVTERSIKNQVYLSNCRFCTSIHRYLPTDNRMNNRCVQGTTDVSFQGWILLLPNPVFSPSGGQIAPLTRTSNSPASRPAA
jgi:hypothetical protein